MDRYFSTLQFVFAALASVCFSIVFAYQMANGLLKVFPGIMFAIIGVIVWKMTLRAYSDMRRCYRKSR